MPRSVPLVFSGASSAGADSGRLVANRGHTGEDTCSGLPGAKDRSDGDDSPGHIAAERHSRIGDWKVKENGASGRRGRPAGFSIDLRRSRSTGSTKAGYPPG